MKTTRRKKCPSPGQHTLRAYLASPLGFSEATREYMKRTLVPELEAAGILVINPWDLTSDEEVMAVHTMELGHERNRALAVLNSSIAKRNKLAIDVSDIVIANLDGQELDSGTVAEVGYAVGKGMPVYGWRADLRRHGEEGAIVNLQVQYFIENSGGTIFRSLADLRSALGAFKKAFRC
jgi:nucleoside 2-deoxyribosyltransferase